LWLARSVVALGAGDRRVLEGIGALDSADFGVAFVDEGFAARRVGLSECWTERFERRAPVRTVRSYPTQRSIRRDYWVATTRSRIVCESHLERHHAMLMDFDPTVVALAAQPFRLYWPGTRGRRGHVPDFFARRSDGTGVVVDVRPDDLIGEEDAVAFAATARACALAGWEFERVGWIDSVLFANVKWLAGFRHPRYLVDGTAARLREVFAAPRGLFEGTDAAGDRIAVLPVLYHLMWRRELLVEVAGGLLGGHSLVRVRGGGR
jgi:hypothetical protein